MDENQIKGRAVETLTVEAPAEVAEALGRCTLTITEQDGTSVEGVSGPMRLFDVDIQGVQEDCDLLHLHEITVTNALWLAARAVHDPVHLMLTFGNEEGRTKAATEGDIAILD